MRTWIIVAALGAALAPGGAGAQGTPRGPAPARAARPARPVEVEAPRLEAPAHAAAPMAHEALAVAQEAFEHAHAAALDLAPALAGLAPMLADLDPARVDTRPLVAALEHPLTFDATLELEDVLRGRPVSGIANAPAGAWLPTDQADSTYREAREALNREQYARASDLFRQIYTRSPKSGYAPDALYWDAFALYRAGGDARLREALGLLERQARDFPRAETRGSAAALATRIRGQLAQEGDPRATRAIERAAAEPACENDDVRIAAINALSQMDASRALPIVRRVLARRDDCSAPLREKAVYVVAQHHPADADQLLLDVVKHDPSPKVRRQAVYYLGQTKSDRAIAALEELVRASEDRDVQERALYSLAENAGARAGDILRGVAERESAGESLRSKAIYYLRERRGGDNSAYLRQLYPRLSSTKLREQVLYSLSEIGGEENVRWLTGVATDTTESVKVRSSALYRVSESRGAAATADLVALYDRLRGREMREKALYYIAQRREPAATAKLTEVLRSDAERPVREKALYYLSRREDGAAIDRVIEVAKSDADREMRRKAIFYLGQSKDPKAVKALEEIIGQ